MPTGSSPLRPQWTAIPQAEFRNNYRQLFSLSDLADFWGIAPSQLGYYAFGIDKRLAYTTFRIPRRNGSERQIETTSPDAEIHPTAHT